MEDTEVVAFLRGSRASFVEDLISSGRTDGETNRLADELEAANFPDSRPGPGHPSPP